MRRILVLALGGVFALTRPAPAQRVFTAEQWRADQRVLATELPKVHRNAFARVPRDTFERAVAELDARIPSLADHEVVVGLTRLVAMLRDGHTRLTLPQDPAVGFDRAHTTTAPPKDSSLFVRHLPVHLDVYAEGLFVRAATPAHRDLIGARVLRVGRASADSALEAVRPVVHYDNEQGFKLLAPTMLAIPEVLHALRLTDSRARATLVVRDRAGATREVVLEPVPLFAAPRFVEAREVAGAPVPLWERDRAAPFWLAYLRPARALYVQMNFIGNAPNESAYAFARRVAAIARDSAVDRVVLDLRHNPGGNNSLARPILLALAHDERVNRPGHLFVMIGRETFSAAQYLVNDLEHFTNVLFVGEPTGSTPSQYGDSRRLQLPNSGLTVRASTIYWRDHTGDERRPWTAPHLAVPLAAADYFANRDPALDSALAFRAGDDPRAVVRRVAAGGDWSTTYRLCWRYDDPRNAPAAREQGMTECGFALVDAARLPMAVQWFDAVVARAPELPRAHYGLGLAHARAGARDKARAALRRALELDPSHREAAELLRSLERVD